MSQVTSSAKPHRCDAPPNPTLDGSAVSVFGCLVKEHSSLYCAIPITSGIRLWHLAKETGVKNLDEVKTKAPRRFASEVLEPNIADGTRFVKAARKLSCLAIDPSRLTMPSWTQEQYAAFWEMVIAKWVRAIVLSPNWIFSKGCVTECIFALNGSIKILDLNGAQVSRKRLFSMLEKAQRTRDELSIDAPFLDSLAKVLNGQAIPNRIHSPSIVKVGAGEG